MVTAKFRVKFARPGITYATQYTTSLEAALELASKRGFTDHEPARRNFDDRPRTAFIAVGMGEGVYETVAFVDADGITFVLAEDRASVRGARETIKQATAQIAIAQTIQQQLERLKDGAR